MFLIFEFVVKIMKVSSFCNLYHAKFIFKSSIVNSLKIPCNIINDYSAQVIEFLLKAELH